MHMRLSDGRNPQLLSELQLTAAYAKACRDRDLPTQQAIEIERDRREALAGD